MPGLATAPALTAVAKGPSAENTHLHGVKEVSCTLILFDGGVFSLSFLRAIIRIVCYNKAVVVAYSNLSTEFVHNPMLGAIVTNVKGRTSQCGYLDIREYLEDWPGHAPRPTGNIV